MLAMTAFGSALKRIREKQRVTQVELAQISGVPRSTIAGLEAEDGKEPRWETAISLAKALNTSLDEFATESLLEGELKKPAAIDRLARLEEAVDLNLQRLEILEPLPDRVALLFDKVEAILAALRQGGIHAPGVGTQA